MHRIVKGVPMADVRSWGGREIDQWVRSALDRDYLDDGWFVDEIPPAESLLTWTRIISVPRVFDARSVEEWRRFLIASSRQGSRLGLVLDRHRSRTSLYIGSTATCGDQLVPQHSRLLGNLVPQMNVEFPVTSALQSQVKWRLGDYTHAYLITGIPSSSTFAQHKPAASTFFDSAIGQLARGIGDMRSDIDFAVMLVAEPEMSDVAAARLNQLHRLATHVYELVHGNQQHSTSHNESQYYLPEPYSLLLALLPSSLWSWFMSRHPNVSNGSVNATSSQTCDFIAKDLQTRLERHIERLNAGQATGLWNVGVAVFADSEDIARTASSLLTASVSSDNISLENFRTKHTSSSLHTTSRLAAGHFLSISTETASGKEHQHTFSTLLNTEELLALSYPPSVDQPGLRSDGRSGSFSMNSPVLHVEGTIELGQVLDAAANPMGTYRLPQNALVRHMLV